MERTSNTDCFPEAFGLEFSVWLYYLITLSLNISPIESYRVS